MEALGFVLEAVLAVGARELLGAGEPLAEEEDDLRRAELLSSLPLTASHRTESVRGALPQLIACSAHALRATASYLWAGQWHPQTFPKGTLPFRGRAHGGGSLCRLQADLR